MKKIVKLMNQFTFVWLKLNRDILNDIPSLITVMAGGKLEIKVICPLVFKR